MPDRYGLDSDGDGRVDRFEVDGQSSAPLNPETWTVRFDACASTGAVSYTWSFGGDTLVTTECDGVEWEFPAEGEYEVALTIETSGGERYRTVKTVRVEDWLIVGIGDSYGYGVGTANFPELSTLFDEYEGVLSFLDELTADLEAEIGKHEEAVVELARRRSIRDGIVNAANAVISDAERVDCCFDRCSVLGGSVPCPCTSCPSRVSDLVSSVNTFNSRVVNAGWEFLKITVEISVGSLTSRRVSDIGSDAGDGSSHVRSWYNTQSTLVASFADAVATLTAAVKDAETVINDFRDRLAGNNASVDGESPTFSAQALTALAIERDNPRTSVTFLHHAISGSEIHQLWGGSDEVSEDSQLGRVLAQVAGREIDALLVSIGGNDAGFSDIVGSCIRHVDCFEPGAPDDTLLEQAIAKACGLISPLVSSCIEVKLEDYPEENAAAVLEVGIAKIPGRFDDLADRLASAFPSLPAERIYFTEYPNVTRNDFGVPCASGTAPGVSVNEWVWLEQGVTRRINDTVRGSVEAAGWNFVDGIFELSHDHGYCAVEHWTVRFEEAKLAEEAGTNGGFAHPTREGYAAFAEFLTARVLAELNARLERPLLPAFLRGDCNDDGTVDISDSVFTLGSLFLGEGEPDCDDACDSNDDGGVDISDAIATLAVLFLGQGQIPVPGTRECGVDPTEDEVGCESYESCP